MSFRPMWIWLVALGCSDVAVELERGAPGALGKEEDPKIVAMVGHGTFLDADGAALELDTEGILENQESLVAALIGGGKDPAAEQRARIDERVVDPVVANALHIDVLVALREKQKKPVDPRLVSIHHALRGRYLFDILGEPAPKVGERWTHGVPEDDVGPLEKDGIIVSIVTGNNGLQYRAECLEAGVPVPPSIPTGLEPGQTDGAWTNYGSIESEVLRARSSDSVLFGYRSTDPPGICLSLPRYDADESGLFGTVCLGSETSNACFFDNPSGVGWPRGEDILFEEFVGGTDLRDVCTDCHAGEDPFIVNPEEPAFADLLAEPLIVDGLVSVLSSREQYVPLVKAGWPQNVGSTPFPADSTGCNGCHDRARPGGRIPDVASGKLPGWCSLVFPAAVGDRQSDPTEPVDRFMPYDTTSFAAYDAHVAYVRDMCTRVRPVGTTVPATGLVPDPEFVSPPLVVGPAYACAEGVEVTGTRYGAMISLFVDGSEVPGSPVEARGRSVGFTVPPLALDAEIWTVQTVNGVASDRSPGVFVTDVQTDYPDGLPVPVIDPVVYECAESIAVGSLIGSTVWITRDGDPSTTTGWIPDHPHWAVFPGGGPFSVGSRFEAKQSLCEQESGTSDLVIATEAPMTLSTPQPDPLQTYTGQQVVDLYGLTNGADTSVSISGTFATRTGSWPASARGDLDIAGAIGRPIQGGDALSGTSELCDRYSPTITLEAPLSCQELPAPRIEPPRDGVDRVLVTDGVPGAGILVYDASGREIGDGAAPIVLLGRSVVLGERLRVVQQLGECRGSQAFEIEVW